MMRLRLRLRDAISASERCQERPKIAETLEGVRLRVLDRRGRKDFELSSLLSSPRPPNMLPDVLASEFGGNELESAQ